MQCTFCERCFIFASIATLAHTSAVPDNSNEQKWQIDRKNFRVSGTVHANVSPLTKELMKPPNNQHNAEENETLQRRERRPEKSESSTAENWCLIWYLMAFGGLICFFLVITCTELFYGSPLYRSSEMRIIRSMYTSDEIFCPESPPPPYHLFAPPDYEEIVQKVVNDKMRSVSVYFIPLREKYSPPEYVEDVENAVSKGKRPSFMIITEDSKDESDLNK